MELHRSHPKLYMIAFAYIAGIGLAWSSQNGWELRILFIPLGSTALLVLGLLTLVFGIVETVQTVRAVTGPAPIRLDGTGLGLHVGGINRFVPWEAVEALVLERGTAASNQAPVPRLVLVPAPGVDLGVAANHQNTVDGRPSIELLPLDAIREPRAEVVAALARFAGPRFIDGTLPTPSSPPA